MLRIITFGIVFIWVISDAYAQNSNIDFSAGDFSNWNPTVGERGNCCTLPYTSGPSHTISTIPGNDPIVGGAIPKIPSGVTQVARLGNPAGGSAPDNHGLAWRMSYPVNITADKPILLYQIAVILDGTHNQDYSDGLNRNSVFTTLITDQSGNRIGSGHCGADTLDKYSGGDMLSGLNTVVYLPWNAVAMNMSAYAGQTVNLQFTTYTCYYLGVHGNSYAYITAQTIPQMDTVYYCAGTNSVDIQGLPRFKNYNWSNGDTTQSAVINNPVENAVYTCTVGSYNGCTATFTYILKEIKITTDFTTAGGNTCNQIQFYDASTTNKGYIQSWYWTFGDPSSGTANTSTEANPLHVYPAPGAYTVTLTVTDTNGCSATVTKIINVSSEHITAQISLPDTVCVYSPLMIEDMTAGVSHRSWQIDGQPMEDTSKMLRYSFSRPGSHTVTLIVTGDNGCPDSLTKTLTIHALPRAGIDVVPSTGIAPFTHPVFQFRGLESGAAAYLWDFGYDGAGGSGEYVSFTYPHREANYTVTVKTYNQYDCFDTASVIIRILPPDIFVPSAFSPNGDGNNDVFRIINITNQKLLGFSIYNRYGQRVFYTINPNTGWDGTFRGQPCETGTYYYSILLSLPDGEEQLIKGDVTLVR